MIGKRLNLARKSRGLSMAALGQAVGVSANAIKKYEHDDMMPSSEVLIALSRALGRSIDFLMSDDVSELEKVDFRKKASALKKDLARVEAEVMSRVEPYVVIEDILGIDGSTWDAPDCDGRRLREVEDAEQLADSVRDAWDLGHDPIPDMTELLERRGVKVLVLDLPKSVDGLQCDARRRDGSKAPVIVVNRGRPLERRRFTLAHELGHLVIDPASDIDHEKAAMRFAGAFLIPRSHLREEVGGHRRVISYGEIMRLKRRYRVSATALLRRFFDVGIISKTAHEMAYRTFAGPWRKNEPEPLEENPDRLFEEPNRFQRLCLRALSEELIGASRAEELLHVDRTRLAELVSGPDAHHSDR